ncbi:unnamed protein product [Blepharisma stoltei]|uniref:Uncharacterized protein n=1 Tax=Blepharisma stoltei TaxID=1481888 RepID=A0AAU9KLM7_9CILI|nr:unnamed protein product [Blepharisma stoltei]
MEKSIKHFYFLNRFLLHIFGIDLQIMAKKIYLKKHHKDLIYDMYTMIMEVRSFLIILHKDVRQLMVETLH